MSDAVVNLETDILIVGAGPTGLTLANLLGKSGIRTIIVERNSSPVDEPRAVSIDDESMRSIQAAGLDAAVEAILARGYGSRYLGPRGDCFALVDSVSKTFGFDKRNAFQQPELEQVLLDGLARFGIVSCLLKHELVEFSQNGESVRADMRRDDGSVVQVLARYMVACDGGRSDIRKTLDIDLVGSTFAERWLIVDLFQTANRFRHTEVSCNPRRPNISLPGPAGIRRYEFLLRSEEDEDLATSEEFVRGLLRDAGPDGDASIRRKRVYSFHARVAARWREGRVFLAGDAAHLSPPFAGQGMNSGLRDAHNLSWKLSAAVRGEVSQDFLDSYEVERKPHALAMIQLALTMGRIMMPTSVLQGVLVRGAFRLMGFLPWIRDYFAQMRFKPPPRFETGLIWSEEGNGKNTMVGRLLPQPVVEMTDRKQKLLDAVLPDGLVVLLFSEFPDRQMNMLLADKFAAAGAPVVGITPEWMNPVSAGFPVVRDVSRYFSEPPLAGYLDKAMLLRPDRYVAAIRPAARAEELMEYIAKMAP
jgi:3-(3-hydroxy-phenyl)propionate hydroxylase